MLSLSLCFCAFLMWLQPLLQRAAPVLKALTCACCLLAADVIVRDKYSVFVGTVSLSVWRRLDLATCVSCPEEENLCTCLCLCRLSRGKKRRRKNIGRHMWSHLPRWDQVVRACWSRRTCGDRLCCLHCTRGISGSQRWDLQMRVETRQETGVDYAHLVPAKHHLEASAAPVLGLGGGFLKAACCGEVSEGHG